MRSPSKCHGLPHTWWDHAQKPWLLAWLLLSKDVSSQQQKPKKHWTRLLYFAFPEWTSKWNLIPAVEERVDESTFTEHLLHGLSSEECLYLLKQFYPMS
jgi:hypothetical protein